MLSKYTIPPPRAIILWSENIVIADTGLIPLKVAVHTWCSTTSLSEVSQVWGTSTFNVLALQV